MKKCVYRFLNENKEIIYIGKAKVLKNRLNGHSHLPDACYKETKVIEYVEFDTNDDMDFAERYYIMKFKPKYNKVLSDKSTTISSFELDIKLWTKLNLKNDEVDDNCEVKSPLTESLNSFETKEHLISKFEIVKEKVSLIVSHMNEYNIDIRDESNEIVKRYDSLIKEEAKLEKKLKNVLIEEGHSSDIAKLFMSRGVYSKEEILEKFAIELEDKYYNICMADIIKDGYYKMNNYYELDGDFADKHSSRPWRYFCNATYIENGIFSYYEIDIEERKPIIERIITNIESRIEDKLGKLKKEVIFLDSSSVVLSGFYPKYNAIKFEEPFIILKPTGVDR